MRNIVPCLKAGGKSPNHALSVVPNNKIGWQLAVLIGILVVLVSITILYLLGVGNCYKELQTTFWEKLEPKPPDPKKTSIIHQQRKNRRQLVSALTLLASSPTFVMGGEQQRAMMAISKIDSKQWTPEQSQLVREVLAAGLATNIPTEVGGVQGVVDSGANRLSTFDKKDIMPGTFKPSTGDRIMQGIAGGLEIVGTGICRFEVLDTYGRVKVLEGPGVVLKNLPIRLIPPQIVMPTDADGDFRINGERAHFVFAKDGGIVPTPLDLATNLPMVSLFQDVNKAASSFEHALYSCVTRETNQNLRPTQRALLQYHWRLGHASMEVIRWHGNRKLLGPMSDKIAKATETPMCATCQYGKQTRRPTGTTHTEIRSDKAGGIQRDKLEPGSLIATDQFETRQRGRRFNTTGRETDVDKFAGGTIFTDVATGYTQVYFQVSLGATEMAMVYCQRKSFCSHYNP